MVPIEKVVLEPLRFSEYKTIQDLMKKCYPRIDDPTWSREQLKKLTSIFPEGQIVIKVDDEIVACALSIIISSDLFENDHKYLDITANDTFTTHSKDGDVMYGLDIMVHPDYRGLRLGRRLYDYRKELCENLNLKGIVIGGRLPNFHKFDDISAKEYIEKVKRKEIHDPVLNFQISNDFQVKRVVKNYLPEDNASESYAALLEWANIYYTKPAKTYKPKNLLSAWGLFSGE